MMNSKEKVGFIGVGQAGGNIAKLFEDVGYTALYINTSEEDLKTLKNSPHQYHVPNTTGCGKDRNLAKNALANFAEEICTQINDIFTQEMIFVAFSTSGGTGSGIAPFLIDILSQETDKKICAIAILPSEKESIQAHINSYDCCKELTEIEDMGCTFFIDNNNSRSNDILTINNIFFFLLNDFLNKQDNYSVRGNIDETEVLKMLSAKGASAITILKNEKSNIKNLVDNFKNNIFAPRENDKIITYVGMYHSKEPIEEIDMQTVFAEIGTPIDLFQGYESDNTVCVLSGMSYPFTRVISIRDSVMEHQEIIKKSLNVNTENKLDDDFLSFIDGMKPKTNQKKADEVKPKKLSARERLMQFKK